MPESQKGGARTIVEKAQAVLWLMILLLTACSPAVTDGSNPEREVVLYNWTGDIPEQVVENFERETGIRLVYLTFSSQEEAIRNIESGGAYDVVVIENQYIPWMVEENLLESPEPTLLPNRKNINPAFWGLAYDPENRFSIPHNWGITGLIVRADQVDATQLSGWSDLWKEEIQGDLVLFDEQRTLMGMALKAAGLSVNTTNPELIRAAGTRLMNMPRTIHFVRSEQEAADLLTSGAASISIGYVPILDLCQQADVPVSFIQPHEGMMLWGDNFVIPYNAPHKDEAHELINYLLRGEVAAQVVNHNRYATANEAALSWIEPELLGNPLIYLDNDRLGRGEFLLSVPADVRLLYEQVWDEVRPEMSAP